MNFTRLTATKTQAQGANGRTYTIGYALGQRNPWVVEEDDSRHRTQDAAEAHCKRVEAGRVADEAGANLTWQRV